MATQAQKDAAFAALKKLEQADVPWYEQSAISDDLLHAIVDTVIKAVEATAPKA